MTRILGRMGLLLPLRFLPHFPLLNQLLPRLIGFGVQRERPRPLG